MYALMLLERGELGEALVALVAAQETRDIDYSITAKIRLAGRYSGVDPLTPAAIDHPSQVLPFRRKCSNR